MPATPSCVPDVLDALTRVNPGRPLITAYDEAIGSRVELSATTYLNWVAKTANLMVDEYLLDAGDVVRLELPTHWLTTVFLGAAWACGLAVTTSPEVEVRLVVRGPEPSDSADVPTLMCSLDPFAGRMRTALPPGVDDYGVLWPGQPDALLTPMRPGPGDPAWVTATGEISQQRLAADAAAYASSWPGGRLLTDKNPLADHGVALVAAMLSGSIVLVANPTDAGWTERYAAELPTLTVAEVRG